MKVALQIFLVFLLLALSGKSAEGISQLRVGIIDVKPWGYEESGVIRGTQIDRYRELEKESGLKFTYILLPLKRALFMLEKGQIDILSVWEREELSDFAERINTVSCDEYFVVELENTVQVNPAINFQVAVQAESNLSLNNLKSRDVKYVGVNYKQLILMLHKQRFGSIRIGLSGLKSGASELNFPLADFRLVESLGQVKEYLYFSRLSPNFDIMLVKKLSQSIKLEVEH
ncbi:type 2 periplasmic-binding domain-containing protein [Shewanella marisflavi]|uniref:Uncharacterized protein n=1 Tax=Shewanella marisflavi TaxID=260364 RepID=A0AAC9XMG0_9GAMM|nr:transporter substrate-binding domain-containing protein [Shewanella marisflavi]ASJ95932.1 hypothetical protein CFF01_04650 [Shewanella marisflavi]